MQAEKFTPRMVKNGNKITATHPCEHVASGQLEISVVTNALDDSEDRRRLRAALWMALDVHRAKVKTSQREEVEKMAAKFFNEMTR